MIFVQQKSATTVFEAKELRQKKRTLRHLLIHVKQAQKLVQVDAPDLFL